MSADAGLVARSADLKRELVEFSQRSRFTRAFRKAMAQRHGDVFVGEEQDLANFIDYFVLQHRLADGRTVVDHFVAARPDLPEHERAMLLGWQDVYEGMFEVQGRKGESLVVVNLIDELTYRVRSNVGAAVFARMPRRSFLITRLVPVGDEWLISGASAVLPATERAVAYRIAAGTAMSDPALVFRNPEKVARGWQLQRQDRQHFIDFFGSDLIVLPASDVGARMRQYWTTRRSRAHDAAAPSVPELELPPGLSEADTVAVIYDEVEGLNFYADFALVEAVFADPKRLADRRHRQTLLGYLNDDSVSPLPLRRLASRDPERAGQLFQQVLRKRNFSWERDGETLLRRRKPSHFDRPTLPSVAPFNERLADHLPSRGRVATEAALAR